MRFRKERRAQLVPLPEEEDYPGRPELAVETATPETQLAVQEEIEHVREAFKELPEEQRAVILMKEYQGLKFHEISEILDIPLSTVKSRMYLGLKTLRKLMERR